MKLEAGKYYKTRHGKKAYVAAVGSPFRDATFYVAIGWIDGAAHSLSWTAIGHFSSDSVDDDRDLVEEWREPRRFTVYVYCCGDSDDLRVSLTNPYESRLYNYRLVAKVEIVEGEGL